MQEKRLFIYILLFNACITSFISARHPFRTHNPDATQVTVCCDGYKSATLYSERLRLYPLFAFSTKDIQDHLIPHEPIYYRNDPSTSIPGTDLGNLVARVVQEVREKKKIIKKAKETTDCTILRDKNFNYKTLHGLIILKCKQYPFVVKIFMENPQSFFDFHSTGIEPPFFFYMGGGANRHLTGITRIRNRALIQETITMLPQWKDRIEMPRKWYWLPEQLKELTLIGKNIGGHQEIRAAIPSVYAIIEDAIDIHNETMRLSSREKRHMIMSLCNDLHIYIDPHPHNYAFIEDPVTKEIKIAIVDTEHFPTMAGFDTLVTFKDHLGWYTYLATNYLGRLYGQTKRDLKALQKQMSLVSIHQPIWTEAPVLQA